MLTQAIAQREIARFPAAPGSHDRRPSRMGHCNVLSPHEILNYQTARWDTNEDSEEEPGPKHGTKRPVEVRSELEADFMGP
jgi:hypothetical protein